MVVVGVEQFMWFAAFWGALNGAYDSSGCKMDLGFLNKSSYGMHNTKYVK